MLVFSYVGILRFVRHLTETVENEKRQKILTQVASLAIINAQLCNHSMGLSYPIPPSVYSDSRTLSFATMDHWTTGRPRRKKHYWRPPERLQDELALDRNTISSKHLPRVYITQWTKQTLITSRRKLDLSTWIKGSNTTARGTAEPIESALSPRNTSQSWSPKWKSYHQQHQWSTITVWRAEDTKPPNQSNWEGRAKARGEENVHCSKFLSGGKHQLVDRRLLEWRSAKTTRYLLLILL